MSIWILAGLIAVRRLLSFAPLRDQLKYDRLMSSPLTSNIRCDCLPNVRIHILLILRYFVGDIAACEGVCLFKNGTDPYSGG